MNPALTRIRAEEKAAADMRQIRARRYGRCQFCGQAISEDSQAHGSLELLSTGKLCHGKPKGRRWVSFGITRAGRIHGDSFTMTAEERAMYAPVLAEMERELRQTRGSRLTRNVPALVEPSQAQIVVFDPDEDWSYPGEELDELECGDVEDILASSEPDPGPEYTTAEILNEWPSRDDVPEPESGEC